VIENNLKSRKKKSTLNLKTKERNDFHFVIGAELIPHASAVGAFVSSISHAYQPLTDD
jgi:hypothetical protein